MESLSPAPLGELEGADVDAAIAAVGGVRDEQFLSLGDATGWGGGIVYEPPPARIIFEYFTSPSSISRMHKDDT